MSDDAKGATWWRSNVDETTTTLTLETLNKAMVAMERQSELFYIAQAEQFKKADRFRREVIPEHLKGDMVLEMVAHQIGRGGIWSSRGVAAIDRYIQERETPMGLDEYLESGGPIQ